MMLPAQISAHASTPPQGLSNRTGGRAVQRKCACGGSGAGAAECETCGDKQRKGLQLYSSDRDITTGLAGHFSAAGAGSPQDSQTRSGIIEGHSFGSMQVRGGVAPRGQRRWDLGGPDDRYESEADSIAQRVTGLHQSPQVVAPSVALGSAPRIIQRAPVDPASSNDPAGADAAPGARNATNRGTAAAGLIVEDDAVQSAPGQMRKTEFLNQLERAVCATADQELTRVGRTAKGCPYIERWIGYYRTRSGPHIERALFRYAPEAAGVGSAGDYIPIVAERIRRAVMVWATTGQITGVPDELAGQIGGGGLLAGAGAVLSGLGGAVAGAVGSIGKVIGGLFRKAYDSGSSQDADADAVQARLGPGQGLDAGVKSRMEHAMGHDFSSVRVHTDSRATELSSELSARAFTVGRDVAFAAGEYRPGTPIGDALLAHELAHVVQQAGGATSAAPMQKAANQHDSLEEDADRSAAGAVLSIWGGAGEELKGFAKKATPHRRSGLGLQRCHHETPTPKGPSAEATPASPSAPPQPMFCDPDRSLTWTDFTGTPSGPGRAFTGFHHGLATDQGKQIVRAYFDGGRSWVRAPYNNPSDRKVNGCDSRVQGCEQFFDKATAAGRAIGATQRLGPLSAGCPASVTPNPSVVATSRSECESALGTECDRVTKLESERLLRHEQLHFDIACVMAKKGSQAVAADPAKASTILAAVITKANKLSAPTGPYDTQTSHGCNATKQAEWEAKVRHGLVSETIP